MALDQNEIQELLELFPNSKAAIERFNNAQTKQKDALDKLAKKINNLKEQVSQLKVRQAEARSEFRGEIEDLLEGCASYSTVEIFLAEHNLEKVNIDEIIHETWDVEMWEDESQIKRVLLNAWNENYDDSEIKSLESTILDLQTLKSQLTA
nr:hypothetical protein [uncultured Haemophilus sp.]